MEGVTADVAFLQRAHLFDAGTCVKREHGQRPGSVVGVVRQEHKYLGVSQRPARRLLSALVRGRVELMRSRWVHLADATGEHPVPQGADMTESMEPATLNRAR